MTTTAPTCKRTSTWSDQSSSDGLYELTEEEGGNTATIPPELVRFRRDVLRFHRAPSPERHQLRSVVIERILATNDPDEYIITVVQDLISSALPGRLDDAVDILSECGESLFHFILELLQSEKLEVNEDFWYVLIRALGKSGHPYATLMVDALRSQSPEATVEALGDIGNIELLREIANDEKNDVSLKELAKEIVQELVEESITDCSE